MKTHEVYPRWHNHLIGREKNRVVKAAGAVMLRYFTLITVVVLVVLTVSLLVLPLVLPPLPPPPFMLLFIPVLIMIALIFMALLPSEMPNVVVASV